MQSSSLGSFYSEEEEAHIYFRARNFRGGPYKWYVINNNSSISGECLSPVFDGVGGEATCHYFSTCTALGSTLYCIGGADKNLISQMRCPRPFRDVYCINVHQPGNGWKKCHTMIQGRARPYTATVDGKIYVFGNYYDIDTICWAEVFDPLSKDKEKSRQSICHWEEDPFYRVTGHAVLDGGKLLLLNVPEAQMLYCYDIEAKSLYIYDKNFGYFPCLNLFFDGIFYCCVNEWTGVICGYDVATPGIPPKPVMGLEEIKGMGIPYLLNVGNGKLCLVWYGDDWNYQSSVSTDKRMVIYCLKFSVSKERNASGGVDLVAHQLPFSKHYVHGDMLDAFVAIFPSQGIEAQNSKFDNTTLSTNINKDNNCGSNIDNKKKRRKKKKKKKRSEVKQLGTDISVSSF